MSVAFLNLKDTYLELRPELDAAVKRTLESGWYVLGDEVAAFEDEFAAYCESKHCVGVANGLDALHLALVALGVGPGDEVIVPSNTYIATWLAVSQCGATPVPVEPDVDTFNIAPALIEAAISPKTKVIIAVHLYGQPADLGPIIELARRHGLKVLEDGAQAHGARYRGKRLGAHGDVVAWSFYPGKNLGAFGDGGAITTDDAELASRVRVLGNYGSRTKYANEVAGFNSRLDELQAAVLRVKLRHLDRFNASRRIIAEAYLKGLADTDLTLPIVSSWAEPVWHLFVVRGEGRDALQRNLASVGIETLIHYPIPPHLQGAYAGMGIQPGALPISEKIHDEALSLPISPTMTAADVSEVVSQVRKLRSTPA
ncbi:DegT/DnrJ/EryC1/StrS family aminotransferase [Cryobacterium sp. TMS1-20-1]|uniref:DegT/DnrJ/EryC1/StrS family aminotransferase n=1 Tax=Cryobacterium sp. TMS1-20-1 TaxID=1259223 RepID=UPI00106C922D|nr:DegT/DnrJ/EryC1/StrS family aminotransferase [Cryobacterium sp. TMS1-20-1]TFC70750.1 DegT/DnrJ/EryC1/StrS family aminotransferase [Cryobacterium sp. TMS1-20-1]